MTSKAITAMIDAAYSMLAAARKEKRSKVCVALSWEATHLAKRAFRFAQPDEADHVPGLSISAEDEMTIIDLCHEAESLRRAQGVEP